MTLQFYPHSEDAQKGTLEERIDLLMDAAQRYKAVILDMKPDTEKKDKIMVPREQVVAYNWEEIARLLREVRESPEISKSEKARKGECLAKLAEVYEVLRAAKMPKLEAVRLALMSEAAHLKQSAQG